MKKIFLAYILTSMVILTSCDRWIDGVAKEIKLPTIEPSLAPFLFIDSRDTALVVNISQTVGVLEDRDSLFVRDAEVQVLKDGNVIHTLNASNYDEIERQYTLSLGGQFGNDPGTYEMKVTAPGFEAVSASQVMPSPIAIDSVNFSEGGVGDPIDGGGNSTIKLTFQDPPNEANYYMALLIGESLDTFPDAQYTFTSWMTSQDAFVEDGWNGPIFNDLSFDGSEVTVNFSTDLNDFSFDFAKYSIRLLSISRDSYTYLKSLSTYFNTQGNPFAEPSLLHSNTENGFGFFGVTTGSEKEVQR